jgi:hypothetical protein
MATQPKLVEGDHAFELVGGIVYLSRSGVPVIAMRRSDFHSFIFDGMARIKAWGMAEQGQRSAAIPLCKAC